MTAWLPSSRTPQGCSSRSSYLSLVFVNAPETVWGVTLTGRAATIRMTVNWYTWRIQATWNPGIGYEACRREGVRLHAAPHQHRYTRGAAIVTTSNSETGFVPTYLLY